MATQSYLTAASRSITSGPSHRTPAKPPPPGQQVLGQFFDTKQANPIHTPIRPSLRKTAGRPFSQYPESSGSKRSKLDDRQPLEEEPEVWKPAAKPPSEPMDLEDMSKIVHQMEVKTQEQAQEEELFPSLSSQEQALGFAITQYKGQRVLVFDNSHKPTKTWNAIHPDPGKFLSIAGFQPPDQDGDPMLDKAIMLYEIFAEMLKEMDIHIERLSEEPETLYAIISEIAGPKEDRKMDWEKLRPRFNNKNSFCYCGPQ